MLLLVYRSIVTMLLVLLDGGRSNWPRRAASSPFLGYLRHHRAVHLRDQPARDLAIAAATDYAIFLIGRYQEARERTARTEKRRTTRCSTARRTSCWARA